MKICRNISSKKVFIFLKENNDTRAYFISPDGSIKLFDKIEFDEFIEETDEMYLKEYMVITDEQYRTYRNHTEYEADKIFKTQIHRRL